MPILPPSPESYNQNTVKIFLGNVINFLLLFAGGLAVIFIIIGAYQYFTAFGNEEKANKAKATITWAVIGVVVIILAKVIIAEVWGLLTNNPVQFPTP